MTGERMHFFTCHLLSERAIHQHPIYEKRYRQLDMLSTFLYNYPIIKEYRDIRIEERQQWLL
jgi:hypothetical protein